jgi:purine-binding chemotaxis protein CheW
LSFLGAGRAERVRRKLSGVTEPPAGERAAPAKKAPRAAPRRPRKKPAPAAPASVQAVVFSLAGDEYALPIGQVQEVIAYTEPRSIASRVSWVRGVINLRGAILPVCDLAARLGRRTRGAGDELRIVVVGSEDGPAGLIVGDVREVITIAPEQLDDVKVTNDPAVTGIAKLGERLVVLLDAPAALAGAELAPARPPG